MVSGTRPTLAALDVLVGEWDLVADFPGAPPLTGGRSVFEWALDGQVLIQRTEVPLREAPDSLVIIAADEAGGGYRQHYFDSRGVARLYAMTFADGVWRLSRTEPDFTDLSFQQRFVATVVEGGAVIRGAWEKSNDGTTWEHDFALTYRRANR